MQIEDLKNCPEHITTIASWDYGHWGFRRDYATFENTAQHYQDACHDSFPHVFVAIDPARALPMGMVSLMEKDVHAPDRPDSGPYLMSLYVQERFRGQGIAQTLISYTEQACQELGFSQIHLNTRNAPDLYKSLGWEILDTAINKPEEPPLFFMGKVLSP